LKGAGKKVSNPLSEANRAKEGQNSKEKIQKVIEEPSEKEQSDSSKKNSSSEERKSLMQNSDGSHEPRGSVLPSVNLMQMSNPA